MLKTQDRPAVIVICGSPGCGKTTYVKRHAKPGDLILDRDAIWQALTGQPYYYSPEALAPFVAAAWDGILVRLEQPSSIYRAWIVVGAPRPEQRQELADRLGAKIILIDAHKQECYDHIGRDARRSQNAGAWQEIVNRWFKNYEAREGDVLIKPE